MLKANKYGSTIENDSKRITVDNINSYLNELPSHMLGIRHDNIANHGWTRSNPKDLAFLNSKKKESLKYLNNRIIKNRPRYRTMVGQLRKISKIFKEHNVDYWLSRGTLLGTIRQNELMRWVKKMTFKVDSKYKSLFTNEEFLAVLRENNMLIEPLFTHSNPSHSFRIIFNPTRIPKLFDVGPSKSIHDFTIKQKLYASHNKCSYIDVTFWNFTDSKGKLDTRHRKLIYPLQEKEINGAMVKIPANPKQTLTWEFTKPIMKEKYGKAYKKDPRLNIFNLITIRVGKRLHLIPYIDYQRYCHQK